MSVLATEATATIPEKFCKFFLLIYLNIPCFAIIILFINNTLNNLAAFNAKL